MTNSLDISLNLVWAAICVSAITWSLWSERRGSAGSGWARMRRVACVFLVVLALFPSVSVSDDEISFWFLFTAVNHRGGAVPIEETKERSAQHLARVLNSLEHFQVNGIWIFTLVLYFVALVLVTAPVANERFRICRPGRAPPVA